MFARLKSLIEGAYARVMPRFWLAMKPQYQWAFGIAIVVTLWLATGIFRAGGAAPDGAAAQAKTAAQIPSVRVAALNAVLRDATITVKGRTQALHEVDVRAEVEGVVKALHFEKGDHVKRGQVLCEIKLNDRGARADQARAQVAQAGKELQVAEDLYKDGFRSKTQLAQAQATYEAAKAGAATMDIQLANTNIRAPFDGVVDDRYVDVGDYMKVGDKCAMVIAPEPFLAVATLSEQEVGEVAVGNEASATLVTGETVQGRVRFVADRADQTTRTFRVEVELPNPDGKLRDGVSADIHIPVKRLYAQKISPGVLVLDDSGVVGVRTVKNGIVRFLPVRIISDGPTGMWVAGLPNKVDVITVGQEFVTDGEHVKSVMEKAEAAL
ncbi:MAG: efflux RND transporter periplasmic adaptor subunit [Alphaproteobacteria bacterium]|nr:efflux RND transporter periplasmic adaptor subunit [Alphaproteobacteria bacterium]MDE2264278.1 efflux RND transporter periplasmic adaptor subunit [Alphaproteobacteria bacterium]MDE2499673.1 efflux RND transporter periplasmic adaptor subunit [Alphaproteobacteria bacterium]